MILRSVSNIVIAPAKTGRERRSRRAVILTAQIKSDKRSDNIPEGRILIVVEMKLIAPRIEEIPAMCKLKMARSTEAPSCAMLAARGG